MTTPRDIPKERLEDLLRGEHNSGFSRIAVLVNYQDERGNARVELGIPYEISERDLILGPYVKNDRTPTPADYEMSKRRIPIRFISRIWKVYLEEITSHVSTVM